MRARRRSKHNEKLLEDLVVKTREEEDDAEIFEEKKGDDKEDTRENSASELFLRSPPCLFLCAEDDLRRSFVDGHICTSESFEQFSNPGDTFGVLAFTSFLSGWGTLGGVFNWNPPYLTGLAAFGCRSCRGA